MLKNNKILLIITSAAILVPIIAGIFLWQKLPDSITTHWGTGGEANGWSSKPVAVFGLPAFLFLIHWVCIFATVSDPRSDAIGKKIFGIVLWICPVISILCGTLIYSVALGIEVNVQIITPMVLGILITVIGNYLPKCKRNYSVGIKVPWTLNDEENWNRTHRFAGLVWVIGGITVMATAFLGSFVICIIALTIVALLPTIYSYVYYKKNKKE